MHLFVHILRFRSSITNTGLNKAHLEYYRSKFKQGKTRFAFQVLSCLSASVKPCFPALKATAVLAASTSKWHQLEFSAQTTFIIQNVKLLPLFCVPGNTQTAPSCTAGYKGLGRTDPDDTEVTQAGPLMMIFSRLHVAPGWSPSAQHSLRSRFACWKGVCVKQSILDEFQQRS